MLSHIRFAKALALFSPFPFCTDFANGRGFIFRFPKRFYPYFPNFAMSAACSPKLGIAPLTQLVCGGRYIPADEGIFDSKPFERRIVSDANSGVARGIRPLASLSWFVLCRVAKNEHQKRPTANARSRVSVKETHPQSIRQALPPSLARVHKEQATAAAVAFSFTELLVPIHQTNKKGNHFRDCLFRWCGVRDSNPRPFGS